MAVRDDDLVSLGPWPGGINNVAKEGKLPTDENGNRLSVREADNIDFDADGWPRSRAGQVRVFEAALTHSLWSTKGLPFALFVQGGQLRVLRKDERVQALDVPMSSHPVSYELINDRIYYTSRSRCGIVTLDLETHAWAPRQPAGQPRLAAVDGFGLDAGQYQVAVTFTDLLGRESGTTLTEAITVASEQGIELQHIPQPADPTNAPIINVYCSRPNEPVLRLAFSIAAGISSGFIVSEPKGRTLTTQFLEAMPAGQLVREFNGRLLVALGREVLYSEPLRYGLYHALRNRQRFADTVDLLEPSGNSGYFVACGHRTFWLAGTDPGAMQARVARSVGAVPGSARVPGNVLGFQTTDDLPVWLDTDGNFCVGLGDGSIKVLKDGDAVADGAERAALLFREEEGLQQVVAALTGRRRQGLAFSDRPVVRVLHDGSAG